MGKIKLSKIKINPNNPRVIKDNKFKELVKSIREFPKMMELRPIVVDDNWVALGGNMRRTALKHLKYNEIPEEWVKKASELTKDEKQRFIIADNVGYGQWDWDKLANEWEIESLEEWGVNVPTIKNTELLSGLEYKEMYYEPKNKPEINLKDCIYLDKFNAKIDCLKDFDITKEQREILEIFAYRFIRIDFQRVADYYAYNATDGEQKAMERLRLVLTDSGIDGFIQDDLLKILKETQDEF
jgi:hypothetical protein